MGLRPESLTGILSKIWVAVLGGSGTPGSGGDIRSWGDSPTARSVIDLVHQDLDGDGAEDPLSDGELSGKESGPAGEDPLPGLGNSTDGWDPPQAGTKGRFSYGKVEADEPGDAGFPSRSLPGGTLRPTDSRRCDAEPPRCDPALWSGSVGLAGDTPPVPGWPTTKICYLETTYDPEPGETVVTVHEWVNLTPFGGHPQKRDNARGVFHVIEEEKAA
jgi:hypothetical protein